MQHTWRYHNANKILAGERYGTRELPILGAEKTMLLKWNSKSHVRTWVNDNLVWIQQWAYGSHTWQWVLSHLRVSICPYSVYVLSFYISGHFIMTPHGLLGRYQHFGQTLVQICQITVSTWNKDCQHMTHVPQHMTHVPKVAHKIYFTPRCYCRPKIFLPELAIRYGYGGHTHVQDCRFCMVVTTTEWWVNNSFIQTKRCTKGYQHALDKQWMCKYMAKSDMYSLCNKQWTQMYKQESN
jgi:hypothetical protein